MVKRSPKGVGVAAMIIGIGAVVFAVFGLGMVGVQRIFLAAIHDPNAAAFAEMMLAVHHLWLINLPIWIVLGAALGWQGLRLQRAVPGAAESVAGLSLAGVAAFVSYALDCRRVAPLFDQHFERLGVRFPLSTQTWMDASVVMAVLICSSVLGTVAVLAWRCRRAGSASI